MFPNIQNKWRQQVSKISTTGNHIINRLPLIIASNCKEENHCVHEQVYFF